MTTRVSGYCPLWGIVPGRQDTGHPRRMWSVPRPLRPIDRFPPGPSFARIGGIARDRRRQASLKTGVSTREYSHEEPRLGPQTPDLRRRLLLEWSISQAAPPSVVPDEEGRCGGHVRPGNRLQWRRQGPPAVAPEIRRPPAEDLESRERRFQHRGLGTWVEEPGRRRPRLLSVHPGRLLPQGPGLGLGLRAAIRHRPDDGAAGRTHRLRADDLGTRSKPFTSPSSGATPRNGPARPTRSTSTRDCSPSTRFPGTGSAITWSRSSCSAAVASLKKSAVFPVSGCLLTRPSPSRSPCPGSSRPTDTGSPRSPISPST